MIGSINGYINPFSLRFRQAVQEYDTLSLVAKISTIFLATIAGLATLPLLGVGGAATFRLLVDRFKNTATISIEPGKRLKAFDSLDASSQEFLQKMLINGQAFSPTGNYIECDLKKSSHLEKFDFPTQMGLPASMLANLKEGDVVELSFEGRSIQLNLGQTEHTPTAKRISQIINSAGIVLGKEQSDPANFYILEEGAHAFRWDESNPQELTSIRKLSPDVHKVKLQSSKSGEAIKISASIQVHPSDVELLITKERLMVTWTERAKAKQRMNSENEEATPDPKTTLAHIKWQQLGMENHSIELKKEMIMNSKIEISSKRITVSIK